MKEKSTSRQQLANENEIDKKFECTLPEGERMEGCGGQECSTCGWEKAECARRREHLKKHGLEKCSRTLKRMNF